MKRDKQGNDEDDGRGEWNLKKIWEEMERGE